MDSTVLAVLRRVGQLARAGGRRRLLRRRPGRSDRPAQPRVRRDGAPPRCEGHRWLVLAARGRFRPLCRAAGGRFVPGGGRDDRDAALLRVRRLLHQPGEGDHRTGGRAARRDAPVHPRRGSRALPVLLRRGAARRRAGLPEPSQREEPPVAGDPRGPPGGLDLPQLRLAEGRPGSGRQRGRRGAPPGSIRCRWASPASSIRRAASTHESGSAIWPIPVPRLR